MDVKSGGITPLPPKQSEILCISQLSDRAEKEVKIILKKDLKKRLKLLPFLSYLCEDIFGVKLQNFRGEVEGKYNGGQSQLSRTFIQSNVNVNHPA